MDETGDRTEEVTLLFVRVGPGRLLGVLGRRASGRGYLAGIPRVIVLDVGQRRCHRSSVMTLRPSSLACVRAKRAARIGEWSLGRQAAAS